MGKGKLVQKTKGEKKLTRTKEVDYAETHGEDFKSLDPASRF